MEHIAVTVQPRSERLTKGERKHMRRIGRIPASLYGRGMESQSVLISLQDIARVLSSAAGANTLLDLTIPDSKGRHLVRLTQVEFEPISRRVMHVALHKIQANEPQKSSLPVEMEGEPEPLRLHEGILEVNATHIDVRSLPERTPVNVTVDVSGMAIGDVIYASDIKLPDGVELLSLPETPIVSVRIARDLTADIPTDSELENATIDEEELEGITRDSSSPEEALQNV
jgi:large subunit ribosomal protein L25